MFLYALGRHCRDGRLHGYTLFLRAPAKEERVIATISFILTLIGAITAVWFLWEQFARTRLSWRQTQRLAERIASDMRADGFDPTLILGIGRGGAITGAMISGALGHRPLIVIDRKYTWVEGRRFDDLILKLSLPPALLERVLLVSGDTHSGNTMRLYHDFCVNAGSREIRKATIVQVAGGTEKIDYAGLLSSFDRKLPWYTSSYRRGNLGEEERSLKLLDPAITTGHGSSTKRIFLIRHAHSVDNDAGDRFSGITDCDITAAGREEATAAGKHLQSVHLKTIYSSPLRRAVLTARGIAAQTGADLVIDGRLREMDYGDWEGKTKQEVAESDRAAYEAWKGDPVRFLPPSSEAPDAVLARTLSFIDDCIAHLRSSGDAAVAIITHKSVIRLLMCHLRGQSLSSYRTVPSSNCGIYELLLDGDGQLSVAAANATVHLST